MNVVEGYANGFSDGWIKCRDFLVQECNLDIVKIISIERSDAKLRTEGKNE